MSLPLTIPYSYGKLIVYFLLSVIMSAGILCPLKANGQTTETKKHPVVFTEKDREAGIRLLRETQDEFVAAISDLTEAQLNYKVSAEKWSIAEVAEHIILAENRIFSIITDAVLKAPAPQGAENFRIKDPVITLALTNRSTKFTAPEPLTPKSRFKNKGELLSNFTTTRTKTIDYLAATKDDLRNRFGELPVLGTIDGYQWFVFVNAHGARHLAQIAEIKADLNFPKR
ncbi:MAG: DinB family protein [Pyrinomonadaceae bacterium]